MSTVHLVVLQHGLWGSPGDVANLTSYLEQALAQHTAHEDEQLAFLKSAVNARTLTYDGIDVCGARLAQLVQDTIQQYAEDGKKVTKLSLVGYSLGGVISRFAAGKLYVAGVFEEVQPMNLITVASPHLGSFREPRGLWARFFNSQVPIIASRTGRQLMLVDSDYSVPWLTQQQELHNKAHKQRETHKSQQIGQQQQQNGQQQQQQEQEEEGLRLDQVELEDGQQQQQQGSASGGSSSGAGKDDQQQQQQIEGQEQQQQQQQPGVSLGSLEPNSPGSSNSSPGSGGSKADQQQQQQQQQHQGVVLPPGVDPDQAVPLLLLMAHPAGPFWRALSHFKTRICAANIKYDTMVPYCTAALCVTNPYEQAQPVPINADKYPSIVRPAKPEEEADIEPIPIRGRSRLFFLAVFMPMFPFFYLYSVSNGFWHHRQAKRRPLDLTWLQQYTVDHNPFSRQVSRRPSQKLRHNVIHQQQWQRQQQQWLSAAAEILEVEAAEARAAADQESPAAAAAAPGTEAAGKQLSSSPGNRRSSSSSSSATGSAAAAVGSKFAQISPFHAAAGADHHQQRHSKDGNLTPPTTAAAGRTSAAMSLERALTSEGVLERDGIIEEPWIVHQQQQWMAQQLFDSMPPCWVPERTTSSNSTSKIQVDLPAGTTNGSRTAHNAGSSSIVVAEAPAAEAEVKSRSEAQTILTTIKPLPDQRQQQQQDSGPASSPPTSPFSAAATDSGSGSGSRGFKSQGGWHRLDVWMGHMHAHAAIMIRDKRFEAESRDVFQYLAEHMSL